jgi:hypothetical protein
VSAGKKYRGDKDFLFPSSTVIVRGLACLHVVGLEVPRAPYFPALVLLPVSKLAAALYFATTTGIERAGRCGRGNLRIRAFNFCAMREEEFCMNHHRTTCVFAIALLTGCFSLLGRAQNPDLQQKVAEIKQAAAANKQALAQYTWVEQTTISLKGEQKKQEHSQVRIGPDGKPQKQSLDPPQQQPPAEAAGGRGGRVKEHVIEKKKEEYKDYAESIKSLIQQYLPPDKDKIEQAKAKGNIALGPQAGAEGQYNLAITNYVKQGDKMTLVFDKARKGLASVTIASYLDDPKDAVNVSVEFATEPSGLNHVSSETINGVSKQLTIVVQNSNYQKL